jgi:hypothetical protein
MTEPKFKDKIALVTGAALTMDLGWTARQGPRVQETLRARRPVRADRQRGSELARGRWYGRSPFTVAVDDDGEDLETECVAGKVFTSWHTETKKGLWICGQFACGEPGRLPWITINPLSTAHPFAHKLHRPLSVFIYFEKRSMQGRTPAPAASDVPKWKFYQPLNGAGVQYEGYYDWV